MVWQRLPALCPESQTSSKYNNIITLLIRGETCHSLPRVRFDSCGGACISLYSAVLLQQYFSANKKYLDEGYVTYITYVVAT
jgi:hypothetical protein